MYLFGLAKADRFGMGVLKQAITFLPESEKFYFTPHKLLNHHRTIQLKFRNQTL